MSQHAHGHGRSIAAVVWTLLLVLAAPAAATTRTIPAHKQTGRTLVYKLGHLDPGKLRSARLATRRQVGRRVVRLDVARVRRAVARGRLRVRMSRRWIRARRRAKRLAGKAQRWRAWRRASVAGRRPRLVLTLADPPRQAPPRPPAAFGSTTTLPGVPFVPAPWGGDLGPIPPGARYLAPDGSNSNPGTSDRPWQTLEKAVASVEPGDTIVLRAGTYGARGTTSVMGSAGTGAAPITWRGHPDDAMPTVLGHFKITASHQRFSRFLFDGPTGPVKALAADNPGGEQVQIAVGSNGDPVEGVEISSSEIRNSGWHAGIYLDGAVDTRIVGNHIHDNGDFGDPAQANQSHGIYWHSGSGLIANNLIEHNVARGVQLYEEPEDVTVAHNTIVRNGRAGVQVAQDAADNLIVNNIVAFNGDVGIRADDLSGDGNRAEGNLVWGPGRLGEHAEGLDLENNIEADPRFAGAASYRLGRASPALRKALAEHVVSHDRAGVARPAEGADLGAYERP